jgi:hypothetical protein
MEYYSMIGGPRKFPAIPSQQGISKKVSEPGAAIANSLLFPAYQGIFKKFPSREHHAK